MINQRQIAAFRAVMITGGITSAAAMLNVTQPAVTRLIRDLEDGIGVPLFDRRRGGKLRPTGDAITLYRDVDRYFIGIDKVSQTASALRQRRVGSLRIASLPALYIGALPHFIGRFLAERPGLDLQIFALSSEAVIDWVQSGRCDLGFVDPSFEHHAIVHHPLATMKALAVIPASHELAEKKVLRPADFASDKFISIARSTQLRVSVDAFFLAAGIKRQFSQEATLSMIACSLVAAGVGLSIVDPLTAAAFRDPVVAFRPLAPAIDVNFSAIHSTRAEPSGSVIDFVGEFGDELERQASRPMLTG